MRQYKFDKAISSAELAALLGGDYRVWHGCAGYDTRPYVRGEGRWQRLPVSYWGGDASNRIPDTGDVEAGDVLGFLEALPLDTVIVVPNDREEGAGVEFLRSWTGWDRLVELDEQEDEDEPYAHLDTYNI